MKQHKYHDIALMAGGSHYPAVGGQLLQKFGDLLIESVIEEINLSELSDHHRQLLIRRIEHKFVNES